MDSRIEGLEPKIRHILSAPGIDLSTISAKRVRKQLLQADLTLTPDFVKDNKNEIDAVIARVYEEISAAQNGNDDEGEEEVPLKRKREDADPSEAEASVASQKKPKKSKSKQEIADEDLARQLQNEINGRARSSRTAAKPKANGAKAKRNKKGPKSSATVNSDGEEVGSGEEDKPKKRGGGFKKEYVLSDPLATLLGVPKLSRPQIVKQLWEHIKANSMQNPENKREIVCDELFRAIFKCDRIDMFKMNKELGQHLYEPQIEAA